MGEAEDNGDASVQSAECIAEESVPQQNVGKAPEDAADDVNAEHEAEEVDDKENASGVNLQLNHANGSEGPGCSPEPEKKSQINSSNDTAQQEDTSNPEEGTAPNGPSLSGLEEVG